jgi:hypothetical protein
MAVHTYFPAVDNTGITALKNSAQCRIQSSYCKTPVYILQRYANCLSLSIRKWVGCGPYESYVTDLILCESCFLVKITTGSAHFFVITAVLS